jgi:hypothetical protein
VIAIAAPTFGHGRYTQDQIEFSIATCAYPVVSGGHKV